MKGWLGRSWASLKGFNTGGRCSDMNPYARHVEAYLEALSKLMRDADPSRAEAVNAVKTALEARGIGPIAPMRTKEAYKAELCSLYAVAKRGLGLNLNDYPKLKELFGKEEACEEAYLKLCEGLKGERLRGALRMGLRLTALGFEEEERFLKACEKLLPPHALNNALRFYAALKVAEEIARNKVKTREELTALRHAQPVKMGRDGMVTPSEALTLAVAENVFGLKLNPSRGGLTAG